MCQKNDTLVKINMLIDHWYEKKAKDTMTLCSFQIFQYIHVWWHYTVEEHIFVFIVYKLLE